MSALPKKVTKPLGYVATAASDEAVATVNEGIGQLTGFKPETPARETSPTKPQKSPEGPEEIKINPNSGTLARLREELRILQDQRNRKDQQRITEAQKSAAATRGEFAPEDKNKKDRSILAGARGVFQRMKTKREARHGKN